MAKSCSSVILASITLDESCSVPLHRQLYTRLRDAILHNQLRPGLRLPSTRSMAAQFHVSRNTVLNAFEQLLAEGYLQGKIGSGTYVAREFPAEILRAREKQNTSLNEPAAKPSLSSRGTLMASVPLAFAPPKNGLKPFQPGLPAIDQFPFKTWQRLIARNWRRPKDDVFRLSAFPDYRPLQDAIATHLGATRGLRCRPEQIMIGTGQDQALDLVARVLIDPGDAVWLRDPGYKGGLNVLRAAGARIVAVPVNEQGIDVEAGIKRSPKARLAYVTPSHQFPFGVTMSLARRLELLDWARWAGAWILEDDYDSEYRFQPPVPALQALDHDGRVVYLGAVSDINLSYVVLPEHLVNDLLSARAFVGQRRLTEQAALADFIAEGHFARHIRRMRSVYMERHEALLRAGKRKLQGLLELQPSQGGIHLTGWLSRGIDDRDAERAAAAAAIESSAVSHHAIEPLSRGGLVLGYGAFTTAEIRESVGRLAAALQTLSSRKAFAAHH